MTEAVNTQPVAETPDAQPPAGAEEQTAARKPDLAESLAEFEAAVPTKTETPTPAPKPGTDANQSPEVLKRVETLERTLAEERFQKNMDPVLKQIRGDIPEDTFSNAELLDWVDGKAKRTPQLQAAWLNRDKNPAAWNKVVGALAQEFAGKFSKPVDRTATNDREAVAAAVRGASTRTPEAKPPDFGRMSNADFDAERAKIMG